jgi:hypothetical protein
MFYSGGLLSCLRQECKKDIGLTLSFQIIYMVDDQVLI